MSDTNQAVYRRWLEASIFLYKKTRGITKALISYMVTVQLISVFDFAKFMQKSRFNLSTRLKLFFFIGRDLTYSLRIFVHQQDYAVPLLQGLKKQQLMSFASRRWFWCIGVFRPFDTFQTILSAVSNPDHSSCASLLKAVCQY